MKNNQLIIAGKIVLISVLPSCNTTSIVEDDQKLNVLFIAVDDLRTELGKKYAVGARNAWGVYGTTIRDENHRLMVWVNNNDGDTLEMNLFDNYEKPIPYTDIADDSPEIVEELLDVLKGYDL